MDSLCKNILVPISLSFFTSNMAGKLDSEAMFEQADSVWKMLNNLAENDPQAYKKFIEKTLKEGSQQFKPPQPCFCVSTILLPEVITHKVYVNVCSWNQIPGPKTDQEPIPVMAGPIEEKAADDSPYSVVDVIFNDKVLKDIEHKKDHKNLLVHLALDYIEETKKLTVSKKYKYLKTNYKGNSSNLIRYLKTPVGGKFESDDSTGNVTPTLNGYSGSKDDLLQQLSSIAVTHDKEPDGISLLESNSKSVKKGLIEELASTELDTYNDPEMRKTPNYEVTIKNTENGRPCQIVVTIELPGVSSVGECELDVSQDDLLLDVYKLYKLQIDLPKKIDDSQVSASFNKATKKLTIKLPVIQSSS